jgi:hypothetical protein
MIYCKISDGIVVNTALFDGSMPEGWAEEGDVWVASAVAQIGWLYESGHLFPPPAAASPLPTVPDVKAEAARRIETIMPDYKQRNVLAFGLETMMTYGTDPADWPAPLQAVNAEMQAKWTAIKAIRTKSDKIEAMDPIPTDFRDDKHWPDA